MASVETTTPESSSTSIRQKPEEQNADIISSLPDGVLSHILSFLPTKTSVATSLLSHRWRDIWLQDLSVLDISDESFKYNEEKPFELFKTLAVFVNSVLTLRKHCQVRKLRLSCTKSLIDDKFCVHSVKTWVRSVIGPQLKELDLTLFAYCFQPPINLSACINLVSLSINGTIFFDLKCATAIRLPSLKKLKLGIGYVKVSSMNALISGCPTLETLDLCFYPEEYGIIRVPSSLKRLKIVIANSYVGASLEMYTPILEYLSIAKIMLGDVGNLQNVVDASLDVFPSPGASAAFTLLKLLSALSGIKHLVMSRSTTKWLLGGPTDLCFPEFRHLIHLELILPWFNSNSLLSLLQTCHILQVLIIQNDKEQSPLPKWAAQTSVPSCLVSHLIVIQFKGYGGSVDELLFAEYILQNGFVLKTMVIADISVDLNKKFDTLKRLSNVPRASGMCQLTFD